MNKDLEELLTRGVDKIYPSKEALEKVLNTGEKIKLYQGFDPTGPELHLGHLAGLLKLRDWQKLGHEAIFLIGDGTGQAGDPSGKTKSRETFFNQETLRSNAKDYKKQVELVLKDPKILYNGDWLNELKTPTILEIAGNFSLQQLVERDLFQERLKKGETISLREALYPLLQAYDSVHMDVDLEVGGSDQTFNMLFGRTLLKAMEGKEKFVMTMPLIVDSTGRKIGKTEGNVIALSNPYKLYAGVMSLPDDVVSRCFESLTRVPMEEIKTILSGHPKEAKAKLAFEIASLLHGDEEAKEAETEWTNTFSKGGVPTDIKTVKAEKDTPLVETLLQEGLVSSKTEFNRLNKEGAIKEIENGVYRIGKHRFLRIESN